MAARDNQTIQIFVIILALYSILASVGLFMINNARKTAVARATSADESAGDARRVQNELQSEANNYKQWIGYAEAESYDDLQKSFADDMNRWGPTFQESDRSFRNILENIFEENRKLAQSESDAKGQLKDVKQTLLATQKQTDDQIAKWEAEAKKAIADKESLRNEFDKARKLIDQEKDKIAAQLAEQREKFDQQTAENTAAQQELQDKIDKKDRVIAIYKSNAVPADPYAQPADGRIAWVNQREGKVWLNIGEADHLRPQVTFTVFSGDVNDVNGAESKGSIEVIRLLSAHMAEARITNDKATRPLMEGDKVYSQVWSRGRQVGFAITGLVDLNGDGSSDLDQLKRIIQLNDGKVDAVPDGKGAMEGSMTVDTRYLVLGKYPEGTRDTSEFDRQSYQKMTGEADTLNIEVISLDDFLSLIGWVSEHRAVKIGPGARSEDFPAREVKDRTPRTLTGNRGFFRPRKPQPSY